MSSATPRIVDATPPPFWRRHPRRMIVIAIAAFLVVIIGVIGVTGGFAVLAGALGPGVTLQDMQSRAFTVTSPPTITITNDVGTVQVVAGVDRQVTVQALRQAHDFTHDLTQSDLDHITLAATQQGSHITITGHTDLAHRTPIGSRSLKLDLLVTLPAQTDLTVTTGAGDVSLTGITGAINANLTAGALRATGLTLAGKCVMQTQTGDISLAATLTTGTKLSLTTTTGNITLSLPAATATQLSGATRVGKITVTGWKVPVTTEHVTGASVKGDTVSPTTNSATLNADVGDISVIAGE